MSFCFKNHANAQAALSPVQACMLSALCSSAKITQKTVFSSHLPVLIVRCGRIIFKMSLDYNEKAKVLIPGLADFLAVQSRTCTSYPRVSPLDKVLADLLLFD